MGSRLVTAAFAFVRAHNERARESRGRELESTEVSLLVLMAHTALDDDTEPSFWLSRSEMCTQLGIRDTEAGRKRVQRALAALKAAGAVTPPEMYQRGRTPRYRLSYQGGRLTSPETTPREMPGVHPTPSKVDAWHPQGGRLASPGMDAQHPPEEQGGTKEEGRARDDTFDLEEPRQPRTPLEPRPYPEQCDRHQAEPHAAPCRACGAARKAATTPARSPRRNALTHVVIGGRRICDSHAHIPTAAGDCANCEIRADDLASLSTIGATA